MKTIPSILFVAIFSISVFSASAGNKDRIGEAGATELLINPWARSSGFNSINASTIEGVESMRVNVAGLAFTRQTEVLLAHSRYLVNSDISLYSVGLAQRLGESSIIGISLMSMDFGEIKVTTTEFPEGGLGTIQPQFFNLGISYAREFSNSIFGGATLRVVSESIPTASAQGVAIDAGIRYVTGPQENIKFGIALRNIGVPMAYSGDGLSFKGGSPEGDYDMTIEHRTQPFEMPSLMHISGAYDFLFGQEHRVTALANFTSNAFYSDQIGAGFEYSFKDMFMVRGAYRWEEGIIDLDKRTSAHTGLAGGFSFQMPLKEGGPELGIDYSFRPSNPYQGTHVMGLRLQL